MRLMGGLIDEQPKNKHRKKNKIEKITYRTKYNNNKNDEVKLGKKQNNKIASKIRNEHMEWT